MDKLFISANSLLHDSMELARLVVSSGFRPTFLVAMWRGGAPIGIAVQEVLEYHSIHADHIAIRTSSYTGIDQQSKTVRVHAVDYLVSRLSAEDELLLVDDVFDSGRSLEAVITELKRRCKRNFPERMRIATVYYKSSRNRSALVPDYYVLDTDKWLVFPHEIVGLTREEILEHKPVGANFFDPAQASGDTQRLRHRQARRADGRKQAAEQADHAGPDDARDDQLARDRQLKHDLSESSSEGADAVAVEENPSQGSPDEAAQ
jgi:hypoxanthine phosphoribosyltransferase